MKHPDQQEQGAPGELGRTSTAREEPAEEPSIIDVDLSLNEISERLGISEEAARALLEASMKAREQGQHTAS